MFRSLRPRRRATVNLSQPLPDGPELLPNGPGPAPDALQIAGLVPFSTVDWPGALCASLFLQGCPWRCPYCHNAGILDLRTPGVVRWEDVEELLRRRLGLLDGVVFSGGEALVQAVPSRARVTGAQKGGVSEEASDRMRSNAGTSAPKSQPPSSGFADPVDRTHGEAEALNEAGEGVSPLEAAMMRVRDLGYRVGLHTAGIYPDRLKRLLDQGLIDWVGLDIKAMPGEYRRATGSAAAAVRAEASLAVLADYDANRGPVTANKDQTPSEEGEGTHSSQATGASQDAGLLPSVPYAQGGAISAAPVAAYPDFDWEVRLTLWPGLLGTEVPSAAELIDYAVEVARWARERGARKFALQRYRVPPGPDGTPAPDASAAPHWDEAQAKAALAPLGFQQALIR